MENDQQFLCTVSRQPAGFDAQQNGTFSVFTSFEWQGAEEGGRDAYERFLARQRGFQFRFFEVDLGEDVIEALKAGDPRTLEARPVETTEITVEGQGTADPALVMGWLDKRNDGQGNGFWRTPGMSVVGAVNATDLKASHALSGLRQSMAPVAEMVGLRRRVHPEAVAADSVAAPRVWLLLAFDEAPPTDVIEVTAYAYRVEGGERLLSLTYPNGAEEVHYTVNLWTGAPPAALPRSIVGADGFVALKQSGPEAQALLQHFEERCHGLFWTLPKLQQPEVFKRIGRFETEPAAPPHPNRAAFDIIDIAVAGCISALDPIVLALRMPGLSDSEEPPEGNLLEHLVDAVLVACAKAAEGLEDGNPLQARLEALDGTGVLRILRDTIANNPLCKEGTPSEIVAELRRVLDLASAPDVLSRLVGLHDKSDDEKLAAIAKLYEAFPATGAHHSGIAAALEGALQDLALSLSTESGAEKAAIRLIAGSGTGGVVNALLPEGLADDQRKIVETALNRAWGDFTAFLNGPFNGFEAIRRSNNHLFAWAASLGPNGEGIGEQQALADVIRANGFLATRWGPPAAVPVPAARPTSSSEAFAHLAGSLWHMPNGLRSYLRKALIEGSGREIDEILSETGFRPDLQPRPLPIQIARTANPDDAAAFNHSYSGVCALLRARGEPWRTPNVCGLDIYDPGTDSYRDYTSLPYLGPVTPTANNGISKAFIGYEGRPFTSRVFDETKPQGAETAVADAFAPVYRLDSFDFDPETAPAWAGSPPLAYGVSYQLIEFAVASDGTLPLALQTSANEPWRMQIGEDFPDGVVPGLMPIDISCSRRTAIGRTEFQADEETGTAARIGATFENVMPLAADYPRLALSQHEVRDLFRQSSGEGALRLAHVQDAAAATKTNTKDGEGGNHGEPIGISIANVKAYAAKTLKIGVLSDPRTGPESPAGGAGIPYVEVSIPKGYRSLQIEFSKRTADSAELTVRWDGNTAARIEIPVDEARLYWLRLEIDAGSLSFEAPVLSSGQAAEPPNFPQPPLLLLAQEGHGFRDRFGEAATIQVSHPRMGIEDVERWLANPDLVAAAGLTKTGSLDRFMDALRAARIVAVCDEKIATLLDRLPDLAVSGLLFELLPLDSLEHDFDGSKSVFVPSPDLRDFDPVPRGDDAVGSSLKTLRNLSEAYITAVTVSGTGSDFGLQRSGRNVLVSVPEGAVALLRVRPAINPGLMTEGRFGASPLHAGLGQLAVGRCEHGGTELLLFEGNSLTLETMSPAFEANKTGLIAEAETRLRIIPGVAEANSGASDSHARSYGLYADAPASQASDNLWRLVGRIDVGTQRWVTTGKPIYSWVDPLKIVHAIDPASGAGTRTPIADLSLRPSADPGLAAHYDDLLAFEKEAFHQRGDIDERAPPVRLEPLPARTLLKSVQWDDPTATWFRHRFTLRSRYEGAYAESSKATIKAWQEGADPWLKRAVVLADASRIEPTRPQQRALLPLTKAPADNADPALAAPPILTILQEPPHAVGGLADRIVCGLQTSLGFETFKQQAKDGGDSGKDSVRIRDARKEIGPDPRLKQSLYKTGPDNSDPAAGVALQVEGPIGLTFEPKSADPRYANTAFMLLAADYGDNPLAPLDFEESFLGVKSLRYLHPGWTFHADASERPDLGKQTAWIEFEGAGEIRIGTQTAIAVRHEGRCRKVEIARKLLRRQEAMDAEPILLARVDAFETLALLHAPIAPDSYLLAAFGIPGGASVKGSGNQPILLATIEWSSAGLTASDAATAAGADLRFGIEGKHRIFPCVASRPTFAEWTRTARNFDVASILRSPDDGSPPDRHSATFADIIATGSASGGETALRFLGDDGLPVWLRPSVQASPFAQHVHRHMAAIITERDHALGRPARIFHSIIRADGAEPVLPFDATDLLEPQIHLLEFESPARPLAYGLPAPLDKQFGFYDLDLRSVLTGPDATGEFAWTGILLSGRFPVTTRGISNIRFRLTGSNADNDACEFDLPLAEGPYCQFEILLSREAVPAAGSRLVVSKSLITGRGTREDAGTDERPVPAGAFLSLRIAGLQADTPVTEFWCDLSHKAWTGSGGMGEPNPLTWLFSDSDMIADRRNAREATRAAQLAGLTEAQARIVSISPALPLRLDREN
ncbi:hypothetical protein [Hoeflea alexandrii]|uniref:hypothetical protein n=1 Tax=Hoeflea alexandrii TaxID=288436 RepID=UPI0022B07852|nr:hypothetical protein [Hoeflea alexandrii]MCZ4287556.1 hypothetical protein [Hoeflea alexandrii]